MTEGTPEQQQQGNMKRSAAGLLRAAGRALFPAASEKQPIGAFSSSSAPLVSSAASVDSPPPPKTGERAPPEARITPDPEDAWRKERRIGRGVGDEPPQGKGSRLGPYHLGGEEVEEEKEGAPATPGQQQQQQLRLQHRRLRSLSVPSPSPPPSHGEEAPAHGADPSTLDDARGSSAPGTPYGTWGNADVPDLDFLGSPEERGPESASRGGRGEGEGDAPSRRASSSSPPGGGGGGGGGEGGGSSSSPQEAALGQRFEVETIWDRLRGLRASEANAASTEAEAEGRVSPEARQREEARFAPRLGGGTGKAL